MSKMQSHLKAIKNILNTLKQLKILSYKIFNAMMNDMGMNHSFMQNASNFMQSLYFLNRPQ